jgi:hypothetical protein
VDACGCWAESYWVLVLRLGRLWCQRLGSLKASRAGCCGLETRTPVAVCALILAAVPSQPCLYTCCRSIGGHCYAPVLLVLFQTVSEPAVHDPSQLPVASISGAVAARPPGCDTEPESWNFSDL